MTLTPEEVRGKTLRSISRASGVPRNKLTDGLKLKADLGISHQSFVVLAQDLRGIIRLNMPFATLLLKEIETAAATVGSVVSLVQGRAKS